MNTWRDTPLNISEGLVGQRKISQFFWFLREREGEGEEEKERVQASFFDPRSLTGQNSSSQE